MRCSDAGVELRRGSAPGRGPAEHGRPDALPDRGGAGTRAAGADDSDCCRHGGASPTSGE